MTLPIRNWNELILSLWYPYLLLLTLPIRNWNSVFNSNSNNNINPFDSTYKELKRTNTLSNTTIIPLLTLPIRNWNLFYLCTNPRQQLLLTLPIRNWNSYLSDAVVETNRPFDSTYKELKLKYEREYDLKMEKLLTLPIRNWNTFPAPVSAYKFFSFDSTYKELKQLFVLAYRKDKFSFDSTYKELKLWQEKC